MAETCENCGKPMKDWSLTHCSEYCLLFSIKNSKTVDGRSDFGKFIPQMKKELEEKQ